jgi:hypothetical protein
MNGTRLTRRLALAAALLGSLLAALVAAGPAPATALPAWRDTGSTWTHEVTTTPRVVGLRYAAHPRFDRVVVDLDGAVPSGRLGYRRHFTYDGSGAAVPILGRSGLQLTLFPAQAHDDAGHSVYTGPMIARPRLRTLKALALTGDFEGQVTFALALTHRARYRVFELSSPTRLVIDVKHAS